MMNVVHEGYHYIDMKKNPNLSVEEFCVVAIPIPENNYSKVGYVEYRYKENTEFKSSELYATGLEFIFILVVETVFLVLLVMDK
jgi:hypothetical protein